MRILLNIIVCILVFLAVSSGITKIMLMQRDVEFFGQYGFTNLLLIAYGAVQLIGGILFMMPKTRTTGAILVAITFMMSAVVLVLAGNIPVAVITLICVILLGIVVKLSPATLAKHAGSS